MWALIVFRPKEERKEVGSPGLMTNINLKPSLNKVVFSTSLDKGYLKLWNVSLYFLYFSAEFTFSGGTYKYKTDVIIFANGSTIWLAPAMFITVCHLDVR